MIFNLGDGMKRIDVPENHVKNNLPLGTVLQLIGYDNPKFCIIKNLGLTAGFESYGAKYKVINIDNGQESIKDALSLDHISKKDVEIRGIHTYFTDAILGPDEIMDLINKAAVKKAADETKEALKKGDLPAIKSSVEKLKKVLQEAGASLYKGQGAQGPGGPGTGGAPGDDGPTGYGPQGGSGGPGGSGNVYDADYKKV